MTPWRARCWWTPTGLASGVSYIDKKTRREVQARGRIVVLAASACETARLLLNSNPRQFPKGLANSSGLVGKYLMDTVGSDVAGFIPALMGLPPHNEDGTGGMHLYMPWWNYQKQLKHELPFARGYHIEFGGGREMPSAGILAHSERFLGGGYGLELKRGCRKLYGAFVGFSGRGEMIPNQDSYCEIDDQVVDQWGIPVLKFHFKWSDDEILQARHMQETFQEIIRKAGGEVIESSGAEAQWGISKGGEIIHEVGTTRMGNDPANFRLESVLSGLGLQEPVRRGRRALREQCGQKPDTYDPGLSLAHQRIHCGPGQEAKLVMVIC